MIGALTKEDLAKYPFCVEAVKYIEGVGVTLSDLAKPGYRVILRRAFERIESAVKLGRVRTDLTDLEVEVLSYPAALAILTIVGEPPLFRRYAVAEAKRIYEELRVDEDWKVKYLAESNFNWRIRDSSEGGFFEMFFVDYLSVAPSFHAPSWKLVNRLVSKGWVRIQKYELARLISEAVRVRIVDRAESPPSGVVVPEEVAKVAEEARKLFQSYRKVIRIEEEYSGPVVESAFPPCIRSILSDLLKGSSLSHMARFALTSFLINVGKSVDEVVSLFSLTADFNESVTRYQVEHIAGLRGSRIKYTPPSCSTLRTFGLCVGLEVDPLCSRVKHPLTYYQIKAKGKKGEGKVEQ